MNGYKKKGSIPYEALLSFASAEKISADFIFYGKEAESPLNCPPDADASLIGKTGIVITSGTIYESALKQNIEAFYHAVKVINGGTMKAPIQGKSRTEEDAADGTG